MLPLTIQILLEEMLAEPGSESQCQLIKTILKQVVDTLFEIGD